MDYRLKDLTPIKVGDEVIKSSGYKFPGVVVASFHNRAGDQRYVVECTAPGASGMLHIYSPAQLEHGTWQDNRLIYYKQQLATLRYTTAEDSKILGIACFAGGAILTAIILTIWKGYPYGGF